MIINGIGWRIRYVPPWSKQLRKYNGEYTLGACDTNTKTIYIREDLNCQYLHKVLSHEIAHATMFSYGVVLDDYTEELLADLFATYGEEILQLSKKETKY